MLYITYLQNGKPGFTDEMVAHVGDKMIFPPASWVSRDGLRVHGDSDPVSWLQSIIEVQADGDELAKIQEWSGLPNNGKRVQTFFGDHAKYIVANW